MFFNVFKWFVAWRWKGEMKNVLTANKVVCSLKEAGGCNKNFQLCVQNLQGLPSSRCNNNSPLWISFRYNCFCPQHYLGCASGSTPFSPCVAAALSTSEHDDKKSGICSGFTSFQVESAKPRWDSLTVMLEKNWKVNPATLVNLVWSLPSVQRVFLQLDPLQFPFQPYVSWYHQQHKHSPLPSASVWTMNILESVLRPECEIIRFSFCWKGPADKIFEMPI